MSDQVPFFSLSEQSKLLKSRVLEKLSMIIDETDFILGREILEFEKSFAEYCETNFALTINNGSAALYVALEALGVKAGDEIILPSATFVATAFAVSQIGATPIFADINPDTWTIDPASVKSKITNHTRAIIAVHLYGNPCAMDDLTSIAEENNILLIEDAAQAHGARYKGKKVGSIGDVGCFSFYPSKNLGAMGEAGAVVYKDVKYHESMMAYRNCGKDFTGAHVYKGFNYRMPTFQAAVLNTKIPLIDGFNQKRNSIATHYKREIQNDKLIWQKVQESSSSVYHLFVVKPDNRQKFIEHLKINGIGYSLHYKKPVHLEPAYQTVDILPVTEDLFSKCVSIPMFPEMTTEQMKRVVEVLNTY